MMFKDLDIHEDTNTIVLFKETPEGSNMLEVVDIDTGQIRFSTSGRYVPLSPRISPTGKEIAFGCMDGKIYSMSLVDGTITPLVDAEGMHSGFGVWSADGSTLCFSSYIDSQTPPDIYTLNMNSGELTQHTNCNRCIDRFPQISPCGQYIVFTRHHLDEPNMPRRAMLLDVTDGRLVQLPQRNDTEIEIDRGCWSGDSKYIIVSELSGDDSCLQIYNVRSNSIQTTISFPDLQGGVFFQREENVLVLCKHEIVVTSMIDGRIEERFHLPDAISIAPTQRGPAAVLNPDETKVYICNEASSVYQLDLMDGEFELIIKDIVQNLSEKEEYKVVSYDGLHIPVHHFKPETAKDLGVLFVIGGPGEQLDDDDPILMKLFNEGYEVIMPAYRGCAGFGQEYQNANKGLYGKGDVEDIISCAKDWKKRNANRPLAIVGYSYGGFLTFLSMAHSEQPFDRGAALWAVTSLEHLGYHLPRAFPSDPVEKQEAMMKRNPLLQTGFIQRPLLILHGGQDTTSTNEEVLTIQQKIEEKGSRCELIIYEDGAHGLKNHRKELFEELLSFLDGTHVTYPTEEASK
ncbi:S9 family peptidase [Sporosarcina highlanderae]|uniref:Prolyl oligopeptidase family serine peptidase n=1 Tax=Sporosarcina highlanderae TaxID=3035916 RepID=A0ABT8JRT9_9BACL|nr:prolyl oligopeptidase family serine peptidase [Sporosarcina highlanderae]MDN4607869.1 prolyl oligopeptidase family serine peptidase [Sporosarcina highlanderae]